MNPLICQLLFKTVRSENKTFLVFSAGKKDKINYSEVQSLEDRSSHKYLLPMRCVSKGRKTKVKYDISGYTSIADLLRNEIDQQLYFNIIAGIQKALAYCQKAGFSIDNLMCDPKFIYCHNISKKVMMVYMPLENKSFVRDDIPKCLKKMHKLADIKVSDFHYKSAYETFINSFNSDNRLPDQAQFDPAALLHFLNSSHMICFENNNEPEQKDAPVTDNNSSSPDNALPSGAGPESDNDSANDEELNVSNTVVRHRCSDAYFTDCNGNRIDIESFPFSIGRNKKNDLVIDEPTVSGDHAVVSQKDGKFFITDSSSSNGTFLNDEDNQIDSSELHSGDKLFFDSFCYTFHSDSEDAEEECSRTVVVSRKKDTDTPVPDAEPVPDLDLEADEAEISNEENCTVVDVRALAYLQKVSDNSIVNITSFPYISSSDEGVMITCDTIGTRKRMFVENTASDALFFEGMVIPEGRKAEMFSGCSLTISGEKYFFRVNK